MSDQRIGSLNPSQIQLHTHIGNQSIIIIISRLAKIKSARSNVGDDGKKLELTLHVRL